QGIRSGETVKRRGAGVKSFVQRTVVFAAAVCAGWFGTDAFLLAGKQTRKQSALLPLMGEPARQGSGIAAQLNAIRRPGHGGEEMLAALTLARRISPQDFAAY